MHDGAHVGNGERDVGPAGPGCLGGGNDGGIQIVTLNPAFAGLQRQEVGKQPGSTAHVDDSAFLRHCVEQSPKGANQRSSPGKGADARRAACVKPPDQPRDG